METPKGVSFSVPARGCISRSLKRHPMHLAVWCSGAPAPAWVSTWPACAFSHYKSPPSASRYLGPAVRVGVDGTIEMSSEEGVATRMEVVRAACRGVWGAAWPSLIPLVLARPLQSLIGRYLAQRGGTSAFPASSLFVGASSMLEFLFPFNVSDLNVVLPYVCLTLMMPTIRGDTHGLSFDWSVYSEYALCSQATLQAKRWWTAVTCLFFHADINHLAPNIAGLILTGYEELCPYASVWFWKAECARPIDTTASHHADNRLA